MYLQPNLNNILIIVNINYFLRNWGQSHGRVSIVCGPFLLEGGGGGGVTVRVERAPYTFPSFSITGLLSFSPTKERRFQSAVWNMSNGSGGCSSSCRSNILPMRGRLMMAIDVHCGDGGANQYGSKRRLQKISRHIYIYFSPPSVTRCHYRHSKIKYTFLR